MQLRQLGLGLVGLGFICGFAACGSGDGGTSPVSGATEQVGELSAPLVESVESPNPTGAVTTFAGKAPPNLPGNIDNTSDPLLGTFRDPAGIAATSNGIVYVADWGNNSIRAIDPGGGLRTVISGRQNLLTNPRAEDVSAPTGIAGWTTASGAWQPLARGSQCNNAICGNPYDGSYWFWGGAVADAVAYQDVDVHLNTNIAAGTQQYYFSATVRGNTEDYARIKIKFLNSAKQLVTPTLGLDTGILNYDHWKQVEATFTPHAATFYIRVEIATHANSGSSADAYLDSMELRALRPSNAPATDVDRGLLGPAAVGVLNNGKLVVGGDGVWTVDPVAQTATKLSGANGYVAPARVASIAVIPGTNRAYLVDPTDSLVHARSTNGFGYTVDVEGVADNEPLSVAAFPLNSAEDSLWVSFRGSARLYKYTCPVPVLSNDRATPVVCTDAGGRLGVATGFTDDVDGTVGGEKFRPAMYHLAAGTLRSVGVVAFDDLLITDEYNGAIRRNNGPYTRTIAGDGDRGYVDGAPGRMWGPGAATVAPNGVDVLVVDRNNNIIRKVACGASSICQANTACPTFPLDDQVDCTSDVCEVQGIRHKPKLAGESCSDGNACNGGETCSASGVCTPGTPPTVDDGKACSTDVCDSVGGVQHSPVPAGTPCSTGNVCSPSGTCNGSSLDCQPGAYSPTDDGNDCTIDACSGGNGVTHTPKAVGTACKTSPVQSINNGTCASGGICASAYLGSTESVDRTVPTPPSALFDDILAGAGGLQGGISSACINTPSTPSCAFVPSHMALVRGTVADINGAGISGAEISIVNHPEFGKTSTYSNGEYIMVVNGGGPLAVRAKKSGKLVSDRAVNPPWGGTDFAADIVLVDVDSKVTAVAFSAPTGTLASGTTTAFDASMSGDNAPSRTAAVFFPSGVVVNADGSSVGSANFRVTEYTVGSNGKSRMPADVAANTMYTYAAEFSLESATGTRYDNVQFSTPVISYVDNFLNLNAGDDVPVGYYDRSAAAWVPMPSGRVIDVKTDGTIGGADNIVPLISVEERTKLLASYSGKKVWRLPLTHFSPLDFNLGIGAPPCDTTAPGNCPGPVTAPLKGADDQPDCGSCKKSGSIIDVEEQVLRESFPIAGTPYSLAYSSQNTLGYGWDKVLKVNLENHPKTDSLRQYEVNFVVAGRQVAAGGLFKNSDGTWPKEFEAVWDGRDYEGRSVQGTAVARLSVAAVYPAVPSRVTGFGRAGRSSSGGNTLVQPELSGIRIDPRLHIWTRYLRSLQAWDASALGLGGWTVSAHHAFDPVGNVLYLGDGTRRKIDQFGDAIQVVAGKKPDGSSNATSPSGTAPLSTVFNDIESLAVSRNGDVFISLKYDRVVRKMPSVAGAYGNVVDYAGLTDQSGPTPNIALTDNGTVAAGSKFLWRPGSIALHDDGRLIVADSWAKKIYEVSADGTTARKIAGKGNGSIVGGCGIYTDVVVDAANTDICDPAAVAVGPDGAVYFVAVGPSFTYAAKIDPAGKMSLVAGNQNAITSYSLLSSNARGPDVALLQTGIAVDRNNTVWLNTDSDLLSIPADGPVRVYPTGFRNQAVRDSWDVDTALDSDGKIVFPDQSLSLIGCSNGKECGKIGGDGAADAPLDLGRLALGSNLGSIRAVAFAPDKTLYVSALQRGSSTETTSAKIVRIGVPALPPPGSGDCNFKVPSEDRAEYYCFDKDGRHKSTVSAYTNGLIRTFQYFESGATAGLLSRITEADGRFTEIDRSTGSSVKIKAPTLQQTTITLGTGNRYATGITRDGTSVAVGLTADPNNGLLLGLVDPDLQQHTFAYDKYGRLLKDADPIGYQLLNRTDSPTAYKIEVTTRMGRTETFEREILAGGTERRTFGLMNGLKNVVDHDLGSTTTATRADGMTVVTGVAPDPIWGMLAPYTSKVVMTAGPYTRTSTTVRVSPGSGQSFTDTTTVSGATTRTFTRSYDDSTKIFQHLSPAGRVTKYGIDAQGRVLSVERPGVEKIVLSINPTAGRIDQVTQGSRISKRSYSDSGASRGFLTEVEDPHLSTDATILKTVFGPDGNARPLTSKRKDLTTLQDLTTNFEWTPSGNLKTLKPPMQQTHGLSYDARGLLKAYSPVAVDGSNPTTTFNLDLDRYLTSVDWPGSEDLSIVMSPKGRPVSMMVGGQKISFAYFGTFEPTCTTPGCALGKPSRITDERGGIVTSFQWYSALPKSVATSLASDGGSSATVVWDYDNDLRVTTETVTVGAHSSTTSVDVDADGLLTCASLGTCAAGQSERVTLGREVTTGFVSTVTVGSSPTETLTYNEFGELRSQSSAPFQIDYEDLTGTPNVLRDAQGRVKRRKERIGVGVATQTYNYTYDEQNRLAKVTDGANSVVGEYKYDNNGNRIHAKNSAGTLDGAGGNIVYDAQDRLTKYGDTRFDYTPRGDLFQRTIVSTGATTTYNYDALGALRAVRLPDGATVEYIVDGRGRRVGKKFGGVLVKQWVYGQGLGPLAELDGTGAIRMRFVYASRANVPDMVKTYPDGKVYRLFSDQLGTPRALYDLGTSTVVRTWNYDEFGVKSSTPGTIELPFGFAGGLYDEHTGLTRFGARDYDPQIGRWVSKDPILFGGGQANLYAYVGNDPINLRDPSGLFWIDGKGVRNWDESETQAILADQIAEFAGRTHGEVCWTALTEGGRYGGRLDFKYSPFFEYDYFWVPGLGRMNAASFGNYFAGYVYQAALNGNPSLPNAGRDLTLFGGIWTHPGTLFSDDAASVEYINRGALDSDRYFESHPWPGTGG
jgi:RHS repeat-associated protein